MKGFKHTCRISEGNDLNHVEKKRLDHKEKPTSVLYTTDKSKSNLIQS